MLMTDVRIEKSTVYGETAVAHQDFLPGDVVVHEAPLLVIDYAALNDINPNHFHEIALQSGIEKGFFDALQSADLTLTEDQRTKLLRQLYSPINYQPIDEEKWFSAILRPTRAELAAASEVLRRKSQLFQTDWVSRVFGGNPEKVISFCHGVRVNTHSDERRDLCGVYPTASKLMHSCAPNTFWFVEDEGHGCKESNNTNHRSMGKVKHVATRAIKKGEMLSFSYIGSGWNLLTHTLERRHMLHRLNFVCQCARCQTFDDSKELCRSLPCPACVSTARQQQKGELIRSKFCSLRLLLCQGGWTCSVCNETLGYQNTAAVLKMEQSFVNAVMSAFFLSSPSQLKKCFNSVAPLTTHDVIELNQQWKLIQSIRRELGPVHYIWVAALCGFMRSLIFFFASFPLCTEPQDDFVGAVSKYGLEEEFPTLSDIVGSIVAGLAWFEKNMPFAPQHIRFLSHVDELAELVQNIFSTAENEKESTENLGGVIHAVVFDLLIRKSEVAGGMLKSIRQRSLASLQPLLKYREFSSIVK